MKSRKLKWDKVTRDKGRGGQGVKRTSGKEDK